MVKFVNTSKLRFLPKEHGNIMKIEDEYIYTPEGYAHSINVDHKVGLEPLGYLTIKNLKGKQNVDGTPAKVLVIEPNSKYDHTAYVESGQKVYTEEMVINIIKSQSHLQFIQEENEKRLPDDVVDLLIELTQNNATDKPNRAKHLLKKYMSNVTTKKGKKKQKQKVTK